jgi:WD40 repeat protein
VGGRLRVGYKTALRLAAAPQVSTMASFHQTRQKADQLHSTARQPVDAKLASDCEFPEDEIAVAAYHIWEMEGRPWGRAVVHWRLAIEQLTARRSAVTLVDTHKNGTTRSHVRSAFFRHLVRFLTPRGRRATTAPGPQEIRIFLAYRRGKDEGDQFVAVLDQNLDGRIIVNNGVPVYRLKTFFDRLTPFSSDWKIYWETHLRTARAMILVCTDHVPRRRAGGDFLFDEIDTWLRYRRTCPILVDAKNLGLESVPPQIFGRWPDAERLDWPAAGDEARLYRRIDEGILLSAVGIDQQDLGRIRRRNRWLGAAALGLLGLALAATYLASVAIKQTVTASSRRLAALSEAERDKRIDRALLLAAEAVRAEDTLEARTSLYRALVARPFLSHFLRPGEGGSVKQVVFSPDGKTLAALVSGRADGTGVLLWRFGGRPQLLDEQISVAEGDIHSLGFAPGGALLAVGYSAGAPEGSGVVLWDLTRRMRVAGKPLAMPEGGVTSIAFSPDGKTLAAGYGSGNPGGAVLWDVARRKRVAEKPLEVPEDYFVGVRFVGPGNTTLATACGTGVVVWDLLRRERITAEPLVAQKGYVLSLTASPAGGSFAAGYNSSSDYVGAVALWDKARLTATTLKVSEGDVSCLAYNSDGTLLAGGYEARFQGGVILWDPARRERVMALPLVVPEGEVSSLAFGSGSTLVAACGAGVAVWDLARGSQIAEEPLVEKEDADTSVAWDASGALLAARFDPRGARGEAKLRMFSAGERSPEQRLTVPEGEISGLAFGPDGAPLALVYRTRDGDGGGVVLWDVPRRARAVDEPLAGAGPVWWVGFSPRGERLGTIGPGGVTIWDLARRQRLNKSPLNHEEGSASCLAFAAGGGPLAVGYEMGGPYRGGVVLWETTDPRRIVLAKKFAVEDGKVSSVAFSPDGKYLAVGGDALLSGQVLLWDLSQSGTPAARGLAVSEGAVSGVAFSADQRLLAACYRGGVVVWRLPQAERLVSQAFTLPGVESIQNLAYQRSGTRVAVGHEKGVAVFDVDVDSWLRLAGEIVGRDLTPSERSDYFPAQ